MRSQPTNVNPPTTGGAAATAARDHRLNKTQEAEKTEKAKADLWLKPARQDRGWLFLTSARFTAIRNNLHKRALGRRTVNRVFLFLIFLLRRGMERA